MKRTIRFAGWFSALFLLISPAALAQGKGHGKGHDKDKHDDEDRYGNYYEHDRDYIHSWYGEHEGHLPPGLAKKDQLPPGLEKQLVVRGTLPPGLQKKIQPCPEDLARRLPPPPPDCENVLVGGHIVLLNRVNFQIVDVFHLELH
jgi:hypothetical protein